MGLKLVSPPEDYPVSVEEIKEHIRIDFDDDDELLEAYLQAALDFIEGPSSYTGRALVDQTWDYFLDSFPSVLNKCSYRGYNLYLEIPLPPLIEVVGVYYLDSDGDEQTVDSSTYTVDVDSSPGRLYMQSWPSAATNTIGAVRIRFRAGYLGTDSPPTEDVPSGIKSAIKLLVANLYENREIIGDSVLTELPFSCSALLRKHRVYVGFA